MVTASGYALQKWETVSSKLVWSLAVYGGGNPGCQTPIKKKIRQFLADEIVDVDLNTSIWALGLRNTKVIL